MVGSAARRHNLVKVSHDTQKHGIQQNSAGHSNRAPDQHSTQIGPEQLQDRLPKIRPKHRNDLSQRELVNGDSGGWWALLRVGGEPLPLRENETMRARHT